MNEIGNYLLGLFKKRWRKQNIILGIFLVAGMIAIMAGWFYVGIGIVTFTVFSQSMMNNKKQSPLLNGKQSLPTSYKAAQIKKEDPSDKILELLQSESPKQLLSFFDQLFKKKNLKDNDIWLQYNKALILSYYGDFDGALEQLSRVDWEKQEPFTQSLELSVKALVHYLKPEDYNEGLRLALAAQKLGNLSKNLPGGAQSKIIYEAYVEIGRLLTGNLNESIIRSLEAKYTKIQYIPKALIAWCLANAYTKKGLPEKANEKLDYIKQIAPHCKPILNVE